MRIYYGSDFHHEAHLTTVLYDEVMAAKPDHTKDILVVAGDVDMSGRSIQHIEAVSPLFRAVIWVDGNHDHWGREITKYFSEFDSKVDNVYYLHNSEIQIDNVVFHGTTGWYKVRPETEFDWRRQQSDPREIRGEGYRQLSFSMVNNQHMQSLKYIEDIDVNDGRKHILISHHPLTNKSLDPKFIGQLSTEWYASDHDELVKKFDVYIHGHVHLLFDYDLDGTPVKCNPFGYPMEKTVGEFKLRYFDI